MGSVRRQSMDDETRCLLGVSEHFFVAYCNHPVEEAGRLMDAFVDRNKRFDEDFMRCEGAYRIAVVVHFLEGLGGG